MASYVETQSQVLKHISSAGYIQKIAGVMGGQPYELRYWHSGTVLPSLVNHSEGMLLTSSAACDTVTGYLHIPDDDCGMYRFFMPLDTCTE